MLSSDETGQRFVSAVLLTSCAVAPQCLRSAAPVPKLQVAAGAALSQAPPKAVAAMELLRGNAALKSGAKDAQIVYVGSYRHANQEVDAYFRSRGGDGERS